MRHVEDDHWYQAVCARDARFDGVIYVGVTTTRIYCRPVCTVRTPGRDRCRFYPIAAAAERDGFRPCLRCRPELAPGHAPVDAVARVAHAAAARIAGGALNDGGSLEALAAEFGLGSRQLRRVVRRELGVSPVELAQTHRLLLAKQLLTETSLPVIQVAFASGFGSVRRLNALFETHYRMTPSRVRRTAGGTARADVPGQPLSLRLGYRPPLPWDLLIDFMAGRSLPAVEQVDGNLYARTVELNGRRGWLTVRPDPRRHALAVELSTSLVPVLPAVLARLRRQFDLDARPDVIDAHLAADPRLNDAVAGCPGLRVPGAFDGFELAVRAVLGQQVSVRAARTLAARLVAHAGEPIDTGMPGLTHLFPPASRLAEVPVTELTQLGVTLARAETLRRLARATLRGEVSLDAWTADDSMITKLRRIPGIGPWTAAYIGMRALRLPNCFPEGDLGLRRALGGMTARDLCKAADRWQPWRAYAAAHLWLNLTALNREK